MSVTISEHVTEALAKEKLSQKQIRRLGLAATLATRHYGPVFACNYRIQFDRDRSVSVVGNKKPCQASLYVARIDGRRVFESVQGNNISQIGLVKFIRDMGEKP